MIKLADSLTCSGCHACFAVCPKACIEMKPDHEGFLQPEIDSSICIECRRCERTCPILNASFLKREGSPLAYAAINLDEAIRKKSSSGGLFSLFATEIIKDGGTVFGAAFDKDFRLKHVPVNKVESLSRLRGSKYLQSTIGQSFSLAKKLLDEGKPVYFSGTPCQIGGLYAFLGRDYENLYTQDLICHGVPSPAVFDRYVKYIEGKKKAKLRSFRFRAKTKGWKLYHVKASFKDGGQENTLFCNDLMMRAFLKNICLRQSCHSCNYKTINRQSDLTLADLWGVEKLLPEMDDDKGISLITLNSDKGRELFSRISKAVEHRKIDINRAVLYNPSMVKSSPADKNRQSFLKELEIKDFKALVATYCKRSVMETMVYTYRNLRSAIGGKK